MARKKKTTTDLEDVLEDDIVDAELAEEEGELEAGDYGEDDDQSYNPLDDGESEIGELMGAATKRYGDVARRANKKKQPLRISTGVFILDLALLGGIPEGRITELQGEKSAGKSTMAMKIIQNAQMQYPDEVVTLIDLELTFDPVWAEKLGVNLDRLQVVECETGERAVDIADAVLGAKETSLLVIDSLAALLPFKEANASAEDDHIGLQSRLIGELCRKIGGTTAHQRMRGCNPTTLFINQYRTKIGQMYGDNRVTPGGRAIEHYASLRMRLKNSEKLGKDTNDVEAVMFNDHEFALTKWKVCNGPRTGSFRLVRNDEPENNLFEGDIDNAPAMLTYAKKFGFWSGAGKNQKLTFDDYDLKFPKQDAALVAINEDTDLYYDLYNALLREQAIARNMPEDFIARFVA